MSILKSRSFLPNLLTLSVLTAFNAAYADTSAPVDVDNQLPVTVVTASRSPEAINIVPASISVIDSTQIQQSPAIGLPNLLRQEAGLNVVELGGYGQQTSIFTRGTNSNETLFLLDGMRMNPANASIPNVQFYDTSDINKIEVLEGPASVQYGSDAIGGVVQLLTAIPTKQNFFATVEGGTDSLHKEVVGADLVHDDAYLQVRAQQMDTDGYKSTTNSASDSGYNQEGYSVKGGISNEQYALSLEARGNQGTADYVNPYTTVAQPLSQDFNNRLFNITGRYTITPDLNINVRLSQFLDTLKQNQIDSYSNSYDFANTDHKELDANIRWDFVQHQNVLAGVTTRETDINSDSYGTAYDRGQHTTGVYLQHQYQDAIFSTQAGVRVEDNQQFGTHTTGQLAGRMQVLPATSIYANVGTAFHAPDADELYGYGGNPNLKPEQSTSYEIGVNQQIMSGLDGKLAVYRTNVNQLINSVLIDPVNYIYQNQNIDKARLTGAEAGLKWKNNDGWFTGLNYAYVQPTAIGQDGASDTDLLRRPRQSVTASAGLQLPHYGFSAELVSKSYSQDTGYTGTIPTPGYAIGNLHGYWQALPNLRFFANVENITDRKYAIAQTGDSPANDTYLAARRQATLGATVNY